MPGRSGSAHSRYCEEGRGLGEEDAEQHGEQPQTHEAAAHALGGDGGAAAVYKHAVAGGGEARGEEAEAGQQRHVVLPRPLLRRGLVLLQLLQHDLGLRNERKTSVVLMSEYEVLIFFNIP